MNRNTNCELYHYGILGQRWGVRRKQTQLESSNSSSNGPRTPRMKNMTNAELDAAVRRMELEKRYRDLNPQKISKGKAFISKVMDKTVVPVATEVTKQMLKEYITSQKKK